MKNNWILFFQDHVLQTFKEIIRYRMKTIDFYMHAIPVFPYEYFMLAVDQIDRYHYDRIYNLLMGIKLLRLKRCYDLLKKIEIFYAKNNSVSLCMMAHVMDKSKFLISSCFSELY